MLYKLRRNSMIMRKPSITAFKKELSPEQREELLRALKAHSRQYVVHVFLKNGLSMHGVILHVVLETTLF